MALDPSADLSSPSVGSPYDSLRIRIPKSESPPGLDLQTDASSAHDFILQFTFQKIKSSKNKNSIHGVNYTLQIIHIVLLYGTEALHLTQKYDTITRFFARPCLILGGGDANGTHCQGHKRLSLLPFLNSYESHTPSNRHWYFEYPCYWTFDS